MRTVAWVSNIGRLTGAELHAFDAAAVKIGTPTDALLAVSQFEAGLDPAARNALSNATGLIQFLPSTAKSLGTTVDDLVKMTVIEQLPFVVRYFSWFKTKLDTVERLYCAVFWPAAIDKPDDYQVAAAASAAYRQNAGFDVNKDGMITRAEICRPVKAILASAALRPRVELPEAEELSRADREAVLNLVSLTIEENLPDPSKVTLPDDDEDPPPTVTVKNS